MNQVIEAARKHYREQLTGALKKMHVEEWGVDIYYTNKINYKDQAKLIDLHAAGKTSEAMIESLIVKARNADGTAMFSHVDRQWFLNEVDPEVLLKIVSHMNTRKEVSPGELEKN